MERQLSQRTVEQIDRQLEFMQMEQQNIMNQGNEDGLYSDGLKDFTGFEELNAGGGEVVLEEVIVEEPAGVPIEEDPNEAFGFKTEVQYYELTPSSVMKSEDKSEESDPEYVPAGTPRNNGRKRKTAARKMTEGRSDGPGRPSKMVKSSDYTPKYKNEESKPGPKAKVPDSMLSKEELARRIQRRARNREAANRQRDKRVKVQTDLENQVQNLLEENSGLKKENSSMKNELEMLRKQLQAANQQPVIQPMNGPVFTQGTNGQSFVLQMVPNQASGQTVQFISKSPSTSSPSSSARSTPNSVSTVGVVDNQTNNGSGIQGPAAGSVQMNNQVYTGPLPSPFTQLLLMSPTMQPVQTQFQFPVSSCTTMVDQGKAAAFQKTIGNL